ncbi:MAG: thymidine phosphorylase [Planctomycetota bacterium]|nr:thymidine phosphorylase [Planctomycetota bacterium]
MSRLDVRALLATKRDGGRIADADVEAFVAAYTAGEVPDYQASALLMAIFIHGMEDAELAVLTRAMLHSGDVFDFSELDGPKVDKHSTGGIGDKVSIPLAPAVAACGAFVPMISGRGLGHTGGTLDKLEAIPGFRTGLEPAEFRRVLVKTGLALGGQTADLVPADRKLYALRDVTGLIESIPLITSSILSKKLAEGIDALVLDVKFGSGAFLTDPARGAELARTMVRIAGECGVRATAFQTNMARPLGREIGNASEINESLACLRGEGPADLRELVCLQGGELLRLVGLADDRAEGEAKVAASLDDGRAFERFVQLTAEQGGDAACLEGGLDLTGKTETLCADRAGYLAWCDLRAMGLAVGELGGGRKQLGDEIDPGVGLTILADEGCQLGAGDPILRVHHRAGRGLDAARAKLQASFELCDEPIEPTPLLLD